MAAAALTLGPVTAGIKGVQQGGKAVEALPFHAAAVLADGHKAEISGLVPLEKHKRRKSAAFKAIVQSVQLLRQRVIASSAAEREFPANQGRKAGKAVQQPFVQGNLPVRTVDKRSSCLAVGGKEIPFVLLWRQTVDHSRQQPSQRISGKVHAAHTVDDPPVRAHEDHIGASANHLHRKLFP